MDLPLRPDDFPLTAIGALVYRRTLSSPMFVAPGPSIAQDLVERLNRDQARGVNPGVPIYASRDATDDVLGKDGE